jgi:hypothetical protein
MASAELSRRVEKVVGYPPLSEMGDNQRREFQALLEAASFEDLPGRFGRRRSWRLSRTGRSCGLSAATKESLAVGPRVSLGVFERMLRLR